MTIDAMASRTRWKTRFGLLLITAVLAVVWLALEMRRFAETPMLLPQAPVEFSVQSGDGLNRLLPKLRAAGIVQGMDWQWKLLAQRMQMAGRIHVGNYAIADRTTPVQLLEKLARGDTERVKFTLVEGRNFRQLLAELKALPDLSDDISGKSAEAIMAQLGRAGVHPEGRFLPDTYFLNKGDATSAILQQALSAMDAALASAWAGRDSSIPLKSADELLIMASIVEKETGIAEERAQIAGVFMRRLQKGMRLETDPTVIYGIGEAYDGDIRKKDLQTLTPYNTYRINGLPPTPIAMPGKAALHATAHPAAGDALFFMASGDGGHVFSATYDAHRKAVADYLKKR